MLNYSFLYRNPNLEFVAAPALAPPEVIMDPETEDRNRKELEEAAGLAMPQDDEDDDL